MSILIKGLDMPMSCGECGEVWCEHWHYSWNLPYESYKSPDCPLVEIPTPHGRLIDADELIEAHYNYCNKHHGEADVFYMWSKDLMDDAPTILEAETNAETNANQHKDALKGR